MTVDCLVVIAAMDFEINQTIDVEDRTDGKHYPCKVTKVDKDLNEIKIHFIGWSNGSDEVIPMESARIFANKNDSDPENSDDDYENEGIGSAIGRLLRSLKEESRQIASTYDIRLDEEDNSKAFQKFKVPALEICAKELGIIILQDDGRKLYKKGALIRKILRKIKAHLPQQCVECDESYCVELKAVPML